MKFWYGGYIEHLKPDQIFVFGSNPEGRHGAGAAKKAMDFGAVYGVGRGLRGQTYALVTKNLTEGCTEFLANGIPMTYWKAGFRSITPEQMKTNIEEMYQCAKMNPDKKFIVAYGANSRNLNGYSGREMFEFFRSFEIPKNVYFHQSFKEFL